MCVLCVYLVAREQWHNENSFTFVHICQQFNIYYVLIRKGHWFRFHVSCNSLIITYSSSSTRLLAFLADFLSSFTNFTTFRRCSLILASLYSISYSLFLVLCIFCYLILSYFLSSSSLSPPPKKA